MCEIRKATIATTALESWQPVGVTIHEGNPDGYGFTLFEDYEDGARAAGIFECEPARTTYMLEFNEIIHVPEASVTIELDTASRVDLEPGDIAFLPKGHLSTWTFHTRFKEFWILAD